MSMHIGVFDSGIGGEAVARDLSKAFPDAKISIANDHEHVPYGTRPGEEIIQLTNTAVQPLLDANCDVIVIACNTATAVAIETLRAQYPSQKFIGLEPMVKPAPSLSKSGVIAICATPATLTSERYNRAKQLYAPGVTIIEPDCSDWAKLIEDNTMNQLLIADDIKECLDAGADVIVLGCTHYHWIKEDILELVGNKAVVLEPTDAIVERIKDLLHL